MLHHSDGANLAPCPTLFYEQPAAISISLIFAAGVTACYIVFLILTQNVATLFRDFAMPLFE
jgi:hypothetical protein